MMNTHLRILSFCTLLMPLPLNLYTAAQVRELDRIAIEDFAIPSFSLMQRAGQVTFETIMVSYPDSKSICVICGTGNNGGDGYVIATLAHRAGLKTTLVQLGEASSIKGDALKARQIYIESGAIVSGFLSEDQIIPTADVMVDAIFGTGLIREVEGIWASVIEAINKKRTHKKFQVVSVDVPSGLHSDTGVVLGCCVKADLTVTFIGSKCGLFTGQAKDYVGKLKFDDLDIPFEVYKHVPALSLKKRLIDESLIKRVLKPRSWCSHKGNFGHVLCIGGAQGMSGAIRLTAEAALRTGAGLVSVATHPQHADLLNAQRPELMVNGITETKNLVPLLAKASVIVIGPGLGQSDWSDELLSLVLSSHEASNKPKILDADALNILSEHHIVSKADLLTTPTPLPPMFSQKKDRDNWILTPHPAEAARLLITKTKLIEQDRYQSAELLQQQYGGVCVLKGAGTIVTDGGRTGVNSTGNPGMASGGMGDLLSGIIAALVAQDLSLVDAASAGVYFHGKAADLAAQQGGERGLLASDLLPFIRSLVNPNQ